MDSYSKRLIEVDLPIRRISEHARREKSIRHGHISTLHIWWARRPLAACRAVLCASLWPDPVDALCPQAFRDAAAEAVNGFSKAIRESEQVQKIMGQTAASFLALEKTCVDAKNPEHWNTLRYLLLDFIAEFAAWEASMEPHFLETARNLTQAAHEALGGTPGTRPLVVDPFAGGGSIPLEALRVGADAFASDLNPVAVLLNKVVLEYIPKYGQRLADEVRRWGQWIKEKAEMELAEFYPNDEDNGVPIAYIWARTIKCEGPGCGVQIPLLRSMILGVKSGVTWSLKWAHDAKGHVLTECSVNDMTNTTFVRPIIQLGEGNPLPEKCKGSVKGGAATCPVCGFVISAPRVKNQLCIQRGGSQDSRLVAVYVQKGSERSFRLPLSSDVKAISIAKGAVKENDKVLTESFPNEEINPIRPYKNTRGLSAVTRIGCVQFRDLYNPRQLLVLKTFIDLVNALSHQIAQNDPAFKNAVVTSMAFCVSRFVSQNTSMSRWDASRLTIKGAFSKQALAVVWDYAEANPFSEGTSNWNGASEWVIRFIESNACIENVGVVNQASATTAVLPEDSVSVLMTDPPYFAAIPYGDLSDFFYVWLRRSLKYIYPTLFEALLSPKSKELIVTNAHQDDSGNQKNELFFTQGMTNALVVGRQETKPQGIGIIVYAEGTTAGWEAIIAAIVNSGWVVTSSWPIDTEMQTRTQAQGAASLQSSVHIVCRPRESPDGSLREEDIGNWRDILLELPERIHAWLPRLADEGVVGADAIFACLGPALEIFSRHSRVEKASGEIVTLREYLEQVWAAVSKEALTLVFKDADASAFEEDARLTAMWLWTLSAGATGGSGAGSDAVEGDDEEAGSDDDDTEGKSAKVSGYTLEYDTARKIAQGLGAHLESLTNLVEVKGDKATLLPVLARTRKLFGKEEALTQSRKGAKKPKVKQMEMFVTLEQLEIEEEQEAASVADRTPPPGSTVLDRVHQTMILFSAGRSEAMKRFLVEEGIGNDAGFWSLAQALSALYPANSNEKRWVDGILARKKGLGF